jgi:pimeloyl-ACP methyl ester carboxylesterase
LPERRPRIRLQPSRLHAKPPECELIKTGQYAEFAGGIRLHYASSGTAGRPLLLCVHGFPEYWGAWEDVLPSLGEWSFAVAPDLRGYNLSSRPNGIDAYRAREIVGDLIELIAKLGYERAFILAHDWGGAAGWQLAISRPQLVQKLVILNSPHPFTFARELANNPEQQRASAYMNRLRAADAEEQLAKDDFTRLFASFTAKDGSEAQWLDAARRARYRAVWSHGLTGALNYYRATPLYPPTDDDPGARALTLDPAKFVVRVPTMVLWGMRDRALLPALLDGLEELVPQITVERLPAASHWLAHEAPGEVAARVRAFLEQ